jgi:hypothetical protein
MLWMMTMDADHNSSSNHETIAGVLTSGLNMEDEISSGVYEDYLDRKRWPAQLSNEAFAEVKRRLTVLIDDTKKHMKILHALVREHDRKQ